MKRFTARQRLALAALLLSGAIVAACGSNDKADQPAQSAGGSGGSGAGGGASGSSAAGASGGNAAGGKAGGPSTGGSSSGGSGGSSNGGDGGSSEAGAGGLNEAGAGGEPASGGTAGSSGAAGEGGSAMAGAAGMSGGGGASACPTNLQGPALVEITASATYCIDATEVTNGDYVTFLAAGVPTAGQVAVCSWNSTFTPSFGWPATGRDANPVGFVDWCDAYAYCQWVGKRLCGKIGGGPSSYVNFASAAESQWMNACSAGGTRLFPYGDTYEALTCNGSDYLDSGLPGTIPVGSATGCEGGYDGLFDLSGNVREWEDSCNVSAGATDPCRMRGGSFADDNADAACADEFYTGRQQRAGSLGFRCCYDPP